MSLPIQKSAANKCAAADPKICSDGGVVFYFTFWVFTFSPFNINFILKIKGTHIASASRFLEQIP
jgi:hypothetical protein